MNNSTTTDQKVPWDISDIVVGGVVVASLVLSFFALVRLSAEDLFDGRLLDAAVPVLTGVVFILVALAVAKIAKAPIYPILWCAILVGAALLTIEILEYSLDAIQSLETLRTATLTFSGPVGLTVTAWTFTRGKHNATLDDLRLSIPFRPTRSLLLRVLGALSLGVLIWFVAFLLIIGWGLALDSFDAPDFLESSDNATSLLEQLNNIWWLAFLLACVATPIAEELFFRSFLLAGLNKRLGVVLGVVISAFIFAAIHTPGVGTGIIIPLFIMGIALSIIYLRTRSVLVSIVIHSMHNTISLVAASNPV